MVSEFRKNGIRTSIFVDTNLKMVENADQVFLLCDSSKIERDSFVQFAPLSMINYLITDGSINETLINKYTEQNVNILMA